MSGNTSEYNRRYYLANRQKRLADAAAYRQQNRETRNAAARQYHQDHREPHNAARQRVHQANAARVFAHYGPGGRAECWCCATDEDLSIDHIDGNGREHRLELFGVQASGGRFHQWLINQGLPEGYQTLCRPCNTSKGGHGSCRINHGWQAGP